MSFSKNNKTLTAEVFKKSKYEWYLDESLDSIIWGYEGIDSLTDSGIYVTTILYKPFTTVPLKVE
jgi:hypothetical protein